MKLHLVLLVGIAIGYCLKAEPKATVGAIVMVGLATAYGFLAEANQRRHEQRLGIQRIQ